jgi:small-conductance mechanosensitive channel
MADFSLNYKARLWIDDISYKLEMKDKFTTGIYKTLQSNKIGIPFPTRTIYMKKSK